nr:hypothetical protein [Tanacetum cinerariifolium]
YIPGPEYPEYLPPAYDVLLAEEQPLPAAVSPTAESPGYITDSEPEMEPEEEDGDDEKSEEDSIDYPTSRGDDNADDDGDDLSKDDADDEDEEESSDSEDEEEEHLALTVPAPALYSSIPASKDSDETEPFEEGETTATPPPFGYRVAARISVQPHILMPFRSESEVERLLAIPTPTLSLVSPTSYPLPPFLMPLPLFTPLPPPPLIILPRTRASMALMRSAVPSTFILAPRSRTPPIGTPSLLPIPLPTSSLPLPLLLLSTSGSESTPEADIPLWKKARFTTPTGGYKVGESSLAAAARQIMPALTVADRRRADDRLIGRLRRERRYFRTLSTTYAQEKMAPKRERTTRANPDPTRTTITTKPMTQEAINNLIAQRVAEALAEYETQRYSVANGDTSNTTGTRPKTVRPTRECTYKDYLNCGTLKFNGTEGVISLTRWFERTESVSSISNCTAENQKTLKQMMTAKYCPRGEIKKLEVKIWNLKESNEIERYVGGLPEMIRGNVMSYEPKSMQKAIEFANDQMDQKLLGISDRQADNKRKFNNTSRNQQNQQPFGRNNNVAQAYAAGSGEKLYRGTKSLCPKCNFYHDGPCRPRCTNCKRTGHIARDYRSRAANTNNNNNNNNYNNRRDTTGNKNQGNRNQGNQNQAGNGNVVARAYGLGTAGGNTDANVLTGTFLLNNHYALILFDTGADKSFVSTAFSSLININPSNLDYSYDVELADGQIIRCDGSNNGNQLNIISCNKTRKYLLKGYPVFLVNITTKMIKDKSKEKRLEDVPIVRDFSKVFPEDLPGLPSTRQIEFQIDLIPGAAPVARAPYRLAPSEM